MAKLTVKKIIVLLLVVATSSVWLLPQKASAAFDDVQFTGPITVYIANSALNLTVLSGSVATTTVSAGNVIFYMNAGSNVLITSSNRKILTNDLGVNTVCTASESQLYLTATADKTVTVSIGGDCPSAGIVGDGGGGGGGTITLDTTAPTVSAVSSQVGSIEAQITWNTNEASLSWVLYGTTTSYGKESLGTTYITSHSAKLTSLNASTTYHYQLKTKDSSGNIGNTSDYTFTTLLSGSLPISTTTITTATTTVTTATTTVSPTPSPTTEIQLSTKPISQMTKTEIQAEIVKITALIAQLQQELLKMLATGPAVSGTKLTLTLKLGSSNNEVKLLQTWLSRDPAVYPEGKITGYFGALTKTAVIKFQEKYASEILTPNGLTKGTGTVGVSTRAKLNALFAPQ